MKDYSDKDVLQNEDTPFDQAVRAVPPAFKRVIRISTHEFSGVPVG